MTWEIVAGNFGMTMKAVGPKGKNLSGCTGKVFVWRDSTYLINGKACESVVYDADADESYAYYDVVDGDIPLSAIVDGLVTIYNVMIEFTKAGYKEHDLGFEWKVHPAPPVVTP